MSLDFGFVSPYVTAILVALGALLVGALNQRHHSIEKRLDELYSVLYRYAWMTSKSAFPTHGSDARRRLLDLLHSKNYLMSAKLLYIYFATILPNDERALDAFPDYWLDEFVRTVRRDYDNYRGQYLSFWDLFCGLFRGNPLSFSPSEEIEKPKSV